VARLGNGFSNSLTNAFISDESGDDLGQCAGARADLIVAALVGDNLARIS